MDILIIHLILENGHLKIMLTYFKQIAELFVIESNSWQNFFDVLAELLGFESKKLDLLSSKAKNEDKFSPFQKQSFL